MDPNDERIVEEMANRIRTGNIQPWKIETLITKEYGIAPPKQYYLATLSRRKYIEEKTGVPFQYLDIPDQPYLMKWQCPQDNSIWHLEARDNNTICSYCGSELKPIGTSSERFISLVSNYVGGKEEYYSYAGEIKVFGDINKTFTNH